MIEHLVVGDPGCVHHRICEGQYRVVQVCQKCGDTIVTTCVPPDLADGAGFKDQKLLISQSDTIPYLQRPLGRRTHFGR